MTLFGTLSPTLTRILKMQTWLEVRNWLVAAGFPPRTKEQLKKKWEDFLSATKANHAKWKKTGDGAIEWTDIDKLNNWKRKSSLVSIVNGIDSGIISKPVDTPLILKVTPVRKTAHHQLHLTFQWAHIGWLDWKVARELQRTSKKKAV